MILYFVAIITILLGYLKTLFFLRRETDKRMRVPSLTFRHQIGFCRLFEGMCIATDYTQLLVTKDLRL